MTRRVLLPPAEYVPASTTPHGARREAQGTYGKITMEHWTKGGHGVAFSYKWDDETTSSVVINLEDAEIVGRMLLSAAEDKKKQEKDEKELHVT